MTSGDATGTGSIVKLTVGDAGVYCAVSSGVCCESSGNSWTDTLVFGEARLDNGTSMTVLPSALATVATLSLVTCAGAEITLTTGGAGAITGALSSFTGSTLGCSSEILPVTTIDELPDVEP